MIWLVGWAPDVVFIAGFAIVAALALHEFLVLGEKKGYPVEKTLSIMLMLLLLAAFIYPQISVEVAVFTILLVLPAFYVFVKSDLEAALPATAVCVLGTLYVGMLVGALLRMRMDFGNAIGA